MGISLRGHVAFVTGASSGIGRSTAFALAKEGVKLLLCARSADKLPTEAELKKAGAEAVHTASLDVSSRDAVDAFYKSLPEDWKKVDVLVNNAGKARGLSKFYEDKPEDWDEMFDTNVTGLLYISKLFTPGMIERGRGHIVNIGSTAGYYAYPNGAAYCGSKAAERFISEGMKLDLLGTPVRVSSVDPGMVETAFSEVRFHGDKERAAKVYQGLTPLTPDDIADVILFAVTRPYHVNIHNVLITTVDQVQATHFNRKTT